MIWESWRYISNREKKIKKILQKKIKIIIKASKVSKRNMNKSLSIVKKVYENVESCID